VVGRNCRFLQVPQTDREAVQRIQEAIAGGQSVTQGLTTTGKMPQDSGRPFLPVLSATKVES
jgi:hypothetical protein